MKLSDYNTYYSRNPETGKYDIPHYGFTERGCGTSTHYSQITKAEYDELNKLTPGQLNAKAKEDLSEEVIMGYGYYGASLFHDKDNDLYFLGTCTGNSCD